MFGHSPVRCPAANCSLNTPGRQQGDQKKALSEHDALNSMGLAKPDALKSTMRIAKQDETSRVIQKYVNTVNKEPKDAQLQKSPELLRIRKRKKLQGKARGKVLMRYVSEETLKNPHMILQKLGNETDETAYKHIGVILNFLGLLFSFEPKGIISRKETRKLTGLLKKRQKDLKRILSGRICKLGKFFQNKTIVGKHWDKVISYIASGHHQNLLATIRKDKLTTANFLPCLAALSFEIMLLTGAKPKKLRSLERRDLAMTWSQEGLVHIFTKNKLYAIVRKDNPDLPPQLDENLWLTKEEHEMLLKLSTFNHNALRLETKLAFATNFGTPLNFSDIVHRHLSENIVTCEEMTWNHLHKQLEMVCSYVSSLVTYTALQEPQKTHDDSREMKLQEARIVRKTMGTLLNTRTEGRMLEYTGAASSAAREIEATDGTSEMEQMQKCGALPIRRSVDCTPQDDAKCETLEETKASNQGAGRDNKLGSIKLSVPTTCPSAAEPQASKPKPAVPGGANDSTCTDTHPPLPQDIPTQHAEEQRENVTTVRPTVTDPTAEDMVVACESTDMPETVANQPGERAAEKATANTSANHSAKEVTLNRLTVPAMKTQHSEYQTGKETVNKSSKPPVNSEENIVSRKDVSRCRNAVKRVRSMSVGAGLTSDTLASSKHPASDTECPRPTACRSQDRQTDSKPGASGMFCSIETMSYDEETDELEIDGYMDVDDIANILDICDAAEL